MNALKIFLFVGTILSSVFANESLVLHPRLSFEPAKNGDLSTRALVNLFVENKAGKTISLPTRGYGTVVSVDDHVVSLIVCFPQDKLFEGKRIVLSPTFFAPVLLKESQLASIDIEFFWPGGIELNTPLDVRLILKKEWVEPYGFCEANIASRCIAEK